MFEEPPGLRLPETIGTAWRCFYGWMGGTFQLYRFFVCTMILLMMLGFFNRAAVIFSLRAECKLLETARALEGMERLRWEVKWYEQNIIIQDLVDELNLTIKMKEEYRKQIEDSIFEGVTGTTYRLTVGECDGNPYQPAWSAFRYTDEKVRTLNYIAVSRDFLKRWGGPFEYGDYVRVAGPYPFGGVKQIVDTMASRWKNRIDLCIPREVKQDKVKGLILLGMQPRS